jgi:hypothetical protein
MTRSLVPRLISRHYGNILKGADSDGRFVGNERDVNIAGIVSSIDSATSLVEVNGVTVLSIHQLDYVTLGTAQFWWSVIYKCTVIFSHEMKKFIVVPGTVMLISQIATFPS